MTAPLRTATFSDAWWHRLAERCRMDPEYVTTSRWLDCRVGVRVGDAEFVSHLQAGAMTWTRRTGTFEPSWQIAFSGSEATWQGFLAAVPPPGYQDLFSLLATVDDFELLGDPLPLFQNIRAIQRWVRLFREDD